MKEPKADQGTENALFHLLLPIARLLVTGGTGIDKLVRAAKRAYLRAAVEAIIPKGQRLNISLLSVATGMTRKEISALLREQQFDRDVVARNRGEQRALRVLRGWQADPRFQNRSGHAGTLPYRGNTRSFTHLVKLYGGDVTPKSVQRELERMHLVEVTLSGGLRLRSTRKRDTAEAYQLPELARLFEDFAFVIMKSKPNSEVPSFFGFKDFNAPSAGDAALFVSRFSRRATALLDDFQEWAAGREPTSSASREKEAVRIGLGVYLLRSDRSLAPDTIGQMPCLPSSKLRR